MKHRSNTDGYTLSEMLFSMSAAVLVLAVCAAGIGAAVRVILSSSVRISSDAYADAVAAVIISDMRCGGEGSFDEEDFDMISPPLYVRDITATAEDGVITVSFAVVTPFADIAYLYEVPQAAP